MIVLLVLLIICQFWNERLKKHLLKFIFTAAERGARSRAQTDIEKLHNHLIFQIKSCTAIVATMRSRVRSREEFISIKNELIKLPKIPRSFLDQSKLNTFIEGIKNSKFFIS